MGKSFLAFGSYFETGDQGKFRNVLQITLENKTLLASVISYKQLPGGEWGTVLLLFFSVGTS